MMDVRLLDLAGEYRSLKPKIDAAVLEVLASGGFSSGPRVSALENALAALCGTPHAVAVASGTDALALILAALDLRPGDEVITTPFTFFAPTEMVLIRGARPVFVDIDPVSFCMDPAAVEAAITPRTVGILPVHLYGHPADMEALTAIAERHRLWLVEDMAQAIAATYADRPVGSFGIASALSFYPTKNLGAYGEAGMVVTRDAAIAERLRLLRNHGSARYSHHEMLGYNSRMDEIQAAILSVKLGYLSQWTETRRRHAAHYTRRLEEGSPSHIGGGAGTAERSEVVIDGGAARPPREREGCRHVYHQYTLRAAERDRIQAGLRERGIESRVYYEEPLHLQPALAHLGYRQGAFPETERACSEVLSLPIHPQLTDAQIDQVATAVIEAARA